MRIIITLPVMTRISLESLVSLIYITRRSTLRSTFDYSEILIIALLVLCCYHENITQITCVTHLYRTKINSQDYYEILNSHFALEHRYKRKFIDADEDDEDDGHLMRRRETMRYIPHGRRYDEL